jgi:phage terminase large subunit-like protein
MARWPADALGVVLSDTQPPLTDKEKREVLAWWDHRKTFKRWVYFTPYPKQREFLHLGAVKRERLLMAANRCGKTETGAFEATCHLTGMYPPWWRGKKFEQSTFGWVCGETSEVVRDVCQAKLLGPPGVTSRFGTGMIPKDLIVDYSLARGVTDRIDTVQVRHKSGGVSVATFKTYEQGRTKFQGTGLDWIWFDEEPSLEVYSEGLTRIGEKDGVSWLTFTPLHGPTAVVLRFTDEPSPDRAVIGMTLDDIPPDGHLSADAKAKMLAGYLPHEREARARGVPMLGSGRIFTTAEEAIIEPPIAHIPSFWKKLWGIDFGIGHPFAAVLALWDVDNDVIHIHHTIRMADALSLAHVAAMKRIGAGVPVAWPHDGSERDRHSGEPLAIGYRRLGLRMQHEHTAWEDGSMSTEAGLMEWDEREKTGRLKVAAHLSEWFEERRFYHRKDGKIVKIKDDLMSATRMILMGKRFARPVPLGGVARSRGGPESRYARGSAAHPDGEYDIFTVR